MNLFPSSWFESKQTKKNRKREEQKKIARRVLRMQKNKKNGDSSSSLDSSASMNTMLKHLRKSIRNIKDKKEDKTEAPAQTQAPAQAAQAQDLMRGPSNRDSYSSYYSSHESEDSHRSKRRGRRGRSKSRSKRHHRHHRRSHRSYRGSRRDGSSYRGSRASSRYDGSSYRGSRVSSRYDGSEGTLDEDYEFLSRMDPSDIDSMIAKLTEMKMKAASIPIVPHVDPKPAEKAIDAISNALDKTTTPSIEKKLHRMEDAVQVSTDLVTKLKDATTDYNENVKNFPEQIKELITKNKEAGASPELITALVNEQKAVVQNQAASLSILQIETQRQAEEAVLKAERIRQESQSDPKSTIKAAENTEKATKSNLNTVVKIIAGTAAVVALGYGVMQNAPIALGALKEGITTNVGNSITSTLGHLQPGWDKLASGTSYLTNAGLNIASNVAQAAALKKAANWWYGAPGATVKGKGTGGRKRTHRR
jgi:hypothetical protein